MTIPDPSPSRPPGRRMWLTDGRDPLETGAAMPIRQVVGATRPDGTWARRAGTTARWGAWGLGAVVVVGGVLGLWQLLYGDQVSGEVWIGRPPAAVAAPTTTAAPTTGASTTSTTTLAPTTVGPPPTTEPPEVEAGVEAEVGDDSSGPGPGPVTSAADRSPNAGQGSSGSGSSGSGSGTDDNSGSGSSGSDD